jgi:hypothetical protein
MFEAQVEVLTERKIKELMTEKFTNETWFDMGTISEVVELWLNSYKESLYELKDKYLQAQ